MTKGLTILAFGKTFVSQLKLTLREDKEYLFQGTNEAWEGMEDGESSYMQGLTLCFSLSKSEFHFPGFSLTGCLTAAEPMAGQTVHPDGPCSFDENYQNVFFTSQFWYTGGEL